MGKENIFITMGLNMLDNGRMTNSMGLVRRHGRMELTMRVSMRKEKNMEKANLYLQTGPCMKGSLITMTFTVLEFISGQIIEGMMESGKETKCMAVVKLHGRMEGHMRESTVKI